MAAYCCSSTHGTPTSEQSRFDLSVASGGLMKVHMVVHRGVPASSPHLPSELAAAASTARAPVRTCSTPSVRVPGVVVSNKRMNSSKCTRTAPAATITKQLRRRLDAFVKRRRVVLELKLPPTIGFELIGVEDGFQDFDDESKALLFCLLTIVWFRLAALALKSRPRLLWNAT